MRSRDVRATTAGLLFIAATATNLIATALLGSLLKGPGFLATVALPRSRIWKIGAVLLAFGVGNIAVSVGPHQRVA